MMNKLIQKLKNKAGESLLESLVAILVFTMSSIVLYSMVTAAANINTVAKEADRANQEQMLVAEQGEGSGTNGTISFTLTKAGNTTVNRSMGTTNVKIYGGNGDLYAYYVTGG